VSHSSESDRQLPTRRPYRISFCITELDPGGAERQLVQLVMHLDRALFEPEVIALSGEGELAAPLREAGIPVTCLTAKRRWDAGVVFRLQRHLRRSRPDLIQTYLFHANIAGRFAARMAGVRRVVCGIRVAERQKRWRLGVDRATDWLVDRHVCVSRDVAEFSRSEGHLPAAKLVVIPNAVDAEVIATATPADLGEFGFARDDQVILSVGRLAEQKDPLKLLNAFRAIAEDFPHVKLLFVGTGPLEGQLRSESADLGHRVRFAGQRTDVPSLMKSALCLALASRWEGMPNVVLEAMAAGLPVVATAAEGVAELLGSEGERGIIVSSHSTADFAAGLRQALSDPQGMLRKASMAQDLVSQQHMVCHLVDGYQRLYIELLGDDSESGPARGFVGLEDPREKKA